MLRRINRPKRCNYDSATLWLLYPYENIIRFEKMMEISSARHENHCASFLSSLKTFTSGRYKKLLRSQTDFIETVLELIYCGHTLNCLHLHYGEKLSEINKQSLPINRWFIHLRPSFCLWNCSQTLFTSWCYYRPRSTRHFSTSVRALPQSLLYHNVRMSSICKPVSVA